MTMFSLCLLVLLHSVGSVGPASNCASLLPAAAQESIRSELNQGWRIVTIDDLPTDDKMLWNQDHVGKCPGISYGHFYDRITRSYVVALLRSPAPGKYVEQLLLLTPAGDHSTRLNVVRAMSVISPFVVWTLAPGKYAGIDGKTPIYIGNESFVYEKMEAVSTQYYFQQRRLRALRAAK